MKSFFKIFLKYYLKLITKLVIQIHRPLVIGVAGSTNKNFVKKEVKARLQELGVSARANPKNFNTEIGLPLAILYLESGYNEYRKWLPIILKAPLRIFQKDFPEYLILGLGTSDEGDMEYLLSMIKPQISIITDITQRYKEGFADMDELVREYEILARKTRKNGTLILNADNYRVKKIGENKPQKVIYYGQDQEAQARITDAEKIRTGQILKLDLQGEIKEYQIPKFGQHHIYAFVIGLIIKKVLEDKHGKQKDKGLPQT